MKKSVCFLLLGVLVGCVSPDKENREPTSFEKENPVPTIETSGDLYYEEGGDNIQMDLFGNCSPGQRIIYILVDKAKAATPCKKGRYRYSMNLPQSFFSESFRSDSRAPSSKYFMKEISAYHEGHKKLKATSYILIDRKRKEVRSVINKQVKFEKIPTGDFEPVTQYNAFGSCAPGTVVKIDIKSPDRFGVKRSKYDETKKCQESGGYYFLSQIDGFVKKGTVFEVYVDQALPKPQRGPASEGKTRYKNRLTWKVPVK